MDLTSYVVAIWPYLGTYLGFGLAFIVIARLMREKRRPSATVAWLLVIWFIPPLGVPLYLIFGGRKISRLTRKKSALNIALPNETGTISSSAFGVISKGNRTETQPTGVHAFKSLIREIRATQESIEITTFILSHDAIGRNVVKELSRRAQAGVEVRLLLDAVGSFGMKTLYMLELAKALCPSCPFYRLEEPTSGTTENWPFSIENGRSSEAAISEKNIWGPSIHRNAGET